MRILILDVDYPRFLQTLYGSEEGLAHASYSRQMQVRNDSLFAVADFYSRNFGAHGHEAREIHVNNNWLQYAWARENGLRVAPPQEQGAAQGPGRLSRLLAPVKPILRPLARRLRPFRMPPWEAEILSAQVEAFAPDVILNQAMEYVRSPVLRRLRKPGRLIVGQIAAPLPEREDYSVYDLILSSLPNFVKWFSDQGISARYNRLAFEPSILEATGTQPQRDIPLSFVGSLMPDHAGRLTWLETIARNAPLQVWGNGVERLAASSPLHACYRGMAWGRGMYDVLRRSRITLNYHIDIAENYANNMRLYEATGSGAMLLTDTKANLGAIFEVDREVAAYTSTQDCLARIRHYLDRDDARAAIAASGQRRTLSDHNYFKRTGEILELIGQIRS
jgi:spore maturation protein CgeB